MKKKIRIINLILVVLLMLSSISFATVTSVIGNPTVGIGNNSGAKTLAQNIIGVIRWAGYIIAVAVLIFVGIKYILASAEEKADMKRSLYKYFIGAILLIFCAELGYWIFNLT